jgi:hypothetical protein
MVICEPLSPYFKGTPMSFSVERIYKNTVSKILYKEKNKQEVYFKLINSKLFCKYLWRQHASGKVLRHMCKDV